jgi:hypothetical protein
MAHRILIVLAAALLVLAVMRRLLDPAMALLVTVWWVVLPPNFGVEYEVHLFGLLPILVAALIVSRSPGRGAKGTALAILVGSTLLLRNELIIAAVIVAIAIVVSEVRQRRLVRVPFSRYAVAYVLPLAFVCLLTAGAYSRSYVQGDEVRVASRAKHNLNVCQAYAFNYQQRHPTRFQGNPFTECAPLMQQLFGRPMPSALQATTANPRAMADFVGWNMRLLASGVQVSLFAATATGDTPGYGPVQNHRRYVWAFSLITVFLLVAGAAAVLADRQFWRREWLPPRAWAVGVLGAAAFTTLVVALTQRPRPDYLYALTVSLMALTGLCSSAILRRYGGTRLLPLCTVGVVAAFILAFPPYYHSGPRPVHDALTRLHGVRESLRRPDSVLVTSGYGYEICSYLASSATKHCSAPGWPELKARVSEGTSIGDVLAAAHVTAIYADPLLQGDPVLAPVLASPGSAGFRTVASGDSADGDWSVLVRTS